MDKKLALEELDRSRKGYDEKLFNLLLGKATLNVVKDQIKEGGHSVKITYNRFSSIIDNLDEDFFARHHIEPLNFNKEMQELVEEEIKKRYKIIGRVIEEYIAKKGLSEHAKDIAGGLDKSEKRVRLLDHTLVNSMICLREVMLHDSRTVLNFGFDYVDRWKMYHELFGDSSN